MPSNLSRAALVSMLTYLTLAAAVGEVWPFSRFTMYARLPEEAAVPVLEVNGDPVFPEQLVDYYGCNASQVRIPEEIPSRTGWRQEQIIRWVTTHSADTPGDVEVQFGYRMLLVDEGGPRLDDTFVELCAGSAGWSK